MTVDARTEARAVAVESNFFDLRGADPSLLPQQIAIVGQGRDTVSYSTDPVRIFSGPQASEIFGSGSPLHQMALELFPSDGDGVGIIPVTAYPLLAAPGATVGVGNIGVSGIAVAEDTVIQVVIGGVESLEIELEEGTTAYDAMLLIFIVLIRQDNTPVTINPDGQQLKIFLTPVWPGESGDAIEVVVRTIVGGDGLSFPITPITGGSVNPDIDDALGKITTKWETMLVIGLNPDDASTLDKVDRWGEGRWLASKHAIAFSGDAGPDLTNASSITSGRELDRTNVLIHARNCLCTPWQVAARECSRVALVANGNPPQEYAGRTLPTLVVPLDPVPYGYDDYAEAMANGIATTAYEDPFFVLRDTVTMYRPASEEVPAYRYVVDLVRLQNVVYSVSLVLDSNGWRGAPMIPNDQATTNPGAKSPKDAEALVLSVVDALVLDAVLVNAPDTRKSISASIDTSNPKRLNLSVTVFLSGNANVVPIPLNFGFFFGFTS